MRSQCDLVPGLADSRDSLSASKPVSQACEQRLASRGSADPCGIKVLLDSPEFRVLGKENFWVKKHENLELLLESSSNTITNTGTDTGPIGLGTSFEGDSDLSVPRQRCDPSDDERVQP